MVMVVDDDDRENEGDLIMAASKATPEAVAFMIRHTSGILCTPILQEQAVKLHLDPMVSRNDAPMSTAFTVSIDYKEGLTHRHLCRRTCGHHASVDQQQRERRRFCASWPYLSPWWHAKAGCWCARVIPRLVPTWQPWRDCRRSVCWRSW